MRLYNAQVEALQELGAWARGPVNFEESNLDGVLAATFTPADETEATKGKVQVLVNKNGALMNLGVV